MIQGLYIWGILYPPTIILIKISILLLYNRIFVLPKFQIIVNLCMALFLCIGIANWLLDWFFCTPISFYWDKTEPGTCVDNYKSYMAGGALNIFMDVVLITLPIPVVWSLQLPKKQKLSVIGIFAMGGL